MPFVHDLIAGGRGVPPMPSTLAAVRNAVEDLVRLQRVDTSIQSGRRPLAAPPKINSLARLLFQAKHDGR